MNKIFFLSNPVREYAWGSRTAIAELLGFESPSARPQAELWLGAHPVAPSMAVDGDRHLALHELIAASPESVLGKQTARHFDNRLPYLMKILAAGQPLSIQVHPDRDLAREGFARENRLGIPLNAPNRNYRDDNHKPELLCALSPFHLLKGFRTPERIKAYLSEFPSGPTAGLVECLTQKPERRALERFFQRLMTLEEHERLEIIEAAVSYSSREDEKRPEYVWLRKLHAEYPNDIGILGPLFLNLICLEPGQSIFLEAGTPHAYLEGVGIEVMANSDNVLRGGLTPKHVDVPELLRALCFVSQPVETITPVEVRPGEFACPAFVEEFVLSRIQLSSGNVYTSPDEHSLDILLCIQGEAALACGPDQRLAIDKGRSVMIPAAAGTYRLSGSGVLYKTSVPMKGTAP